MEEGKMMTRNMAKAANPSVQHADIDQRERLQTLPGSRDLHDKGKPDVLVRGPIRSYAKDKNEDGRITSKHNSKSVKKKEILFTKTSDSDDGDASDDSERSYKVDPNIQQQSKVLYASKEEENTNRRQQRDKDEERTNRHQQRVADPVNSTQDLETGHHGSFSDVEDERKSAYRSQQRGGFRPQAPVIRSPQATEVREVIPNTPGYAPQDRTKNIGNYLLVLLVVLGALAAFALRPLILEKPDGNKVQEDSGMKDFYDGFRKLPINFTNQSQSLWSRSQRILELHLRNQDNKQPAIILLTAAQDAEQTLHCVGNKLAKTYASALNSKYTVISGPDRKSEDSEDVKEEIDDKLSAAFQATARAAVLHRLELLPPGSLLILYKYCDHENANFKNVALVLTVLLDDSTLKTDIALSDLEEKVRDFFDKTFIVSGTKKSHNEMDVDKLSGVWSRISHVVLPVFPERDVGKHCEETESKV